MRVVHKYGGSSVSTTEKIKNIANHIKSIYLPGDEIVIVVSAMGKTTNNLLSLAHEITNNPDKREEDALLSTGEMISASLLAIALNDIGLKAISLTGKQAGIVTNSSHSRAFIESIEPDRLYLELSRGNIVIITGFQGEDKYNDVTTLGRGGSDTSAVAIAAVLSCPCEIYTDVDSVYSVDPREYPSAKKINTISYEEMMEMSVHGAKVLETRCIELAKKYNVPLYLGKTLELNKNKGTFVMNKNDSYFEKTIIRGLSIKDDYKILSSQINSFDTFDEIINKISNSGLNFEMISEVVYNDKIYFSLGSANDELFSFSKTINSEFNINSNVTNGYTKLSITGTGFSTHTKVLKLLINTLNLNNIKYNKISVSEITISVVIGSKDREKAINKISESFNL